PIDSAVISISTKSAPLIRDCYAETECTRETGPTYTTFSVVSISELSPVTVVITQSRSAFTSVNPANIGPQPDSWAEQFVRTALFGLAIAVVLVFLIIRWAKRRAITIQTVKVFDFVRFEPPMGLSVAEVAAAWHGGFSTRALTASLVQMAADGVVELDSTNGELTVIVKDESKAKIPWQQQLVHAISRKGSPAHLTEYDEDFASSVNATGSALVAEAEQKGILNPKANRSRIAMIVGIAISVASLIFVMPMVAAPQIFGFVFLIPIAGFIGFAIGYRITPKVQTEKSAEFLSAVAGFEKLFTTDAAAARREFAHRSGLTPAAIFATLLPFAIIYEAEASWVGAFPDITPDELRAYGYNVASMGAMTSLTQNTEAALSAAMTSPSSSGSGSGGGSAGGGGGGGGGGSW
ncbi:MAG: putative rane protein, partial [Actinomycetota bacterium]